MKNIFLSFAACIATLAVMSGCSTKFNIAAPYQNITIVYGLLDQGDTAHYIRIQKAFLSQTLSAYDMEKVADSNFYPVSQINVVMKAFDVSHNMIGAPVTLTRVDLTQEGYPKDSGAFFNAPSYAYKFKAALNPNYTYRLVITNTSTGVVDSSETTIIDESVANFTSPQLDNPSGPVLSFARINGIFTISGKVSSTAAFMQGVVRVRWVDKNALTGTSTKQYADWNFSSYIPVSSGDISTTLVSYNLTANTRDYYNFLLSAMQPAAPSVSRYIDSAYVSIYAASTPFYNYLLFNQNLGIGLTGSDIQPNYTNIFSTAGFNRSLGLFAGRGVRNQYIIYDAVTIDSLVASPLLSTLNIKGATF